MAGVENIDKAVSEDEYYYVRQVFVCCKKSRLPGVELEEGLLPQRFARSFEDHKADFDEFGADHETELFVCDEGGGDTYGDVLIFPGMVRYKAIKETEVDAFVEDVVLNGKPWSYGIQQELRGSFVFVCDHDKDAYALLDKFEEAIVSRGVSDQIFVKLCSRLVGGHHECPENLIVYCNDSDASGDYTLTPKEVPEFLDRLLIITARRRDQVKPNLEAEKVEEGLVLEQESLEKQGGCCCQCANGISCCQELLSRKKKEEGSIKDPEPIKKDEGFMKLKWFRSMEKHELLLGVAALAINIAVDYYFYRRSG